MLIYNNITAIILQLYCKLKYAKHSKNIAKKIIIMAKVSFILDTRHEAQSGFPLKIRITHNNSNAARSTGIYLKGKDWDEDYQRVRRCAPNARSNNEYIESLLFEYRQKIYELDRDHRLGCMKAKDILTYIEHGDLRTDGDMYFNSRLQAYANNCIKPKSANSFLYTGRTVMEFVHEKRPKVDRIFMTDIDYDFLMRFEKWMERKGMKINTRAIHMTNIRTIWNEASKRKELSRDLNPFYGDDGYKIHRVLKEKEYLPIDGMRKLLELDFSGVAGREGLEKARDMFMLSFYLCGINPIDLWNMPKCQCGEMVFVRKKIERREPDPVRIYIPAAAQEIIDKYSDGPLMLNFEQHYLNFENFYSFIRHRIDRIGHMIGYPKMTLGWSRYTWSTYAMKTGASDFQVDRMLGHMPNSVNAKHYASFEWEDDGRRITNQVVEYARSGVAFNSVPAPKYVLVGRHYQLQ